MSRVAKAQAVRYRLSVPADDALVHEWIDAQHNKSMSIRMLIRKQVDECGINDFFATGTPAVQALQQPTKPQDKAETASKKKSSEESKSKGSSDVASKLGSFVDFQ